MRRPFDRALSRFTRRASGLITPRSRPRTGEGDQPQGQEYVARKERRKRARRVRRSIYHQDTRRSRTLLAGKRTFKGIMPRHEAEALYAAAAKSAQREAERVGRTDA